MSVSHFHHAVAAVRLLNEEHGGALLRSPTKKDTNLKIIGPTTAVLNDASRKQMITNLRSRQNERMAPQQQVSTDLHLLYPSLFSASVHSSAANSEVSKQRTAGAGADEVDLTPQKANDVENRFRRTNTISAAAVTSDISLHSSPKSSPGARSHPASPNTNLSNVSSADSQSNSKAKTKRKSWQTSAATGPYPPSSYSALQFPGAAAPSRLYLQFQRLIAENQQSLLYDVDDSISNMSTGPNSPQTSQSRVRPHHRSGGSTEMNATGALETHRARRRSPSAEAKDKQIQAILREQEIVHTANQSSNSLRNTKNESPVKKVNSGGRSRKAQPQVTREIETVDPIVISEAVQSVSPPSNIRPIVSAPIAAPVPVSPTFEVEAVLPPFTATMPCQSEQESSTSETGNVHEIDVAPASSMFTSAPLAESSASSTSHSIDILIRENERDRSTFDSILSRTTTDLTSSNRLLDELRQQLHGRTTENTELKQKLRAEQHETIRRITAMKQKEKAWKKSSAEELEKTKQEIESKLEESKKNELDAALKESKSLLEKSLADLSQTFAAQKQNLDSTIQELSQTNCRLASQNRELKSSLKKEQALNKEHQAHISRLQSEVENHQNGEIGRVQAAQMQAEEWIELEKKYQRRLMQVQEDHEVLAEKYREAQQKAAAAAAASPSPSSSRSSPMPVYVPRSPASLDPSVSDLLHDQRLFYEQQMTLWKEDELQLLRQEIRNELHQRYAAEQQNQQQFQSTQEWEVRYLSLKAMHDKVLKDLQANVESSDRHIARIAQLEQQVFMLKHQVNSNDTTRSQLMAEIQRVQKDKSDADAQYAHLRSKYMSATNELDRIVRWSSVQSTRGDVDMNPTSGGNANDVARIIEDNKHAIASAQLYTSSAKRFNHDAIQLNTTNNYNFHLPLHPEHGLPSSAPVSTNSVPNPPPPYRDLRLEGERMRSATTRNVSTVRTTTFSSTAPFTPTSYDTTQDKKTAKKF